MEVDFICGPQMDPGPQTAPNFRGPQTTPNFSSSFIFIFSSNQFTISQIRQTIIGMHMYKQFNVSHNPLSKFVSKRSEQEVPFLNVIAVQT